MRIISLCPSLTELVCDLGLGDALVGRTRFCVHPADRMADVESVGGTKNPRISRIVELAPDIVLLNEEENRVEDAEALIAAGVRCHSSFPRTAADTVAMVREIGDLLAAGAAGERIAADIEQRAEAVRARARDTEPVRYAYLIWRKPLMSVSDDTFIAAMLALPGGVNVFGQREERYPEIEPEDLSRADPPLVLLSTEPFPFAPKHVAELSAATHLPASRFRIVDGQLLSWHGSRTAPGIDYAERVIRGDAGRLEATPPTDRTLPRR